MQAVGGYVNTGILIVQGLLLVPLYLHYIGAHMYGFWLASGGMLGMLGLVNFGISSMMIQRIASSYGKKNMVQAGAYFINGAAIYLGICLLYGVIGWVVSMWLPQILKATHADGELLRNCFQLAVVAMSIGIFNECLRSFAQALLRPVFPMLGMAVGRILGISVTVWMLFDDFGLWALPAGTLLAEFIIFVFNLIYAIVLFRKLNARISLDKNIMKEYVKTSPALLGARLGNTLSQESEPLFITIFLTPEVTAAYMITRRAADIVFNMLSQIVGSSMGSFAHLAGENNNERTSQVAQKLLTLIFPLSLIGFTTYFAANSAFVTLWVGKAFALNQNVIFLIGIGFFVRIIRSMLWQLLNGLGDFVYTSKIILLEGAIRIALVVTLLQIVGVLGVPVALVVGCLLSLMLFVTRMSQALHLKVGVASIGKVLLSSIVLFGASVLVMQFATNPNSWGMFVLYLFEILIVSSLMFILINWKTYQCVIIRSNVA